MSSDALDIYDAHLDYQLGQYGHFTEAAVIDPSGPAEQTIYGIYDDHASSGNKDSGNVRQLENAPRFITADALSTIDVYDNLEIQVRGISYRINRIDPDANGGNVIWLS